MLYTPLAERQTWMEGELARTEAIVQIGRSIDHVIAALVEDPPPRPQLLVIDLDSIGPIDVVRLHSIREQGWFGTIVALGRASEPLRASLGIETLIIPPFARDTLHDVISVQRLETTAQTVRIPVLRGA